MLAIVLLSVSTTACGDTGKATSSTAQHTVKKRDRDDDGDNNDDDAKFLNYGHAATGRELQEIKTLVTSYYAAAAAEDGAKACSLLIPFIAESVAENYGHTPTLSGKTCAVVMSKLFKLNHQLLVGKSATLKFYAVRVGGAKALTVLSFATLPEVRLIAERRVDGTWRMLDLLDGIME